MFNEIAIALEIVAVLFVVYVALIVIPLACAFVWLSVKDACKAVKNDYLEAIDTKSAWSAVVAFFVGKQS